MRFLGHEPVRTLSECRHDGDHAVRVGVAQPAEERAYALADAGISPGTRSRWPVTATTSGTA